MPHPRWATRLARAATQPFVALALFVVAPCAAVGAQSPDSAISYTVVATVDSGGGRHGPSTTMRVRAAHGMIRLDTSMGDSTPAFMRGIYMLLPMSSDSVLTVMPNQQVISVGEPGAGLAAAMGAVKFGLVDTPSYHAEELGDGPTILGYPTHHFRSTLDYVLDVGIDGEHCQKPVHTVTDIWEAPSASLPAELVTRVLGRITAATPGSGGLSALRTLQTRQPRGAILRSEVRSGNGVTLRSETTELTRVPLDSSVFARPTGYRLLEPSLMATFTRNEQMRDMLVGVLRKSLCGGAATP